MSENWGITLGDMTSLMTCTANQLNSNNFDYEIKNRLVYIHKTDQKSKY